MAARDEVRESAAAIAGTVQSAEWVHGLSVVLDGEPLVALDRASRRGYHLTMAASVTISSCIRCWPTGSQATAGAALPAWSGLSRNGWPPRRTRLRVGR